MSETVKLIIEIPKPMYENVQNCTYCGTLYKELKNGVPLDDVKAEIKKNILDEPVENGTNAEMACYNGGLLKCLEIIDKRTEKESEE